MKIKTKIVLKPGKEASLKRLHPWIFSGAIKKVEGENPVEGDLVEVYSSNNDFLAIGHCQIGSIAVRVISFKQTEINRDFWRAKIQKAITYRKAQGFFNNKSLNAFRLIHAEGDNIPGLVADYYNGIVVLQIHSIGILDVKNEIAEIIREELRGLVTAIYNKSSNTLPFKANVPKEDEFLFGDTPQATINEYGNKFIVDVVEGQKTGFFLDQRENRRLLGEYSKGKRVLNVFGYTGGFSVYALNSGAEEVVTIDVSKKAIDLTNKNVDLNSNAQNHKGLAVDAFEYFSNIDEEFDIIILDPPAFAKHQNVLNNAKQAYKRINLRALQKLKKGGMLFTFSCSQVVSKEDFRKSVFAAATQANQDVKIVHQLGHAPDHPVNIFHPESEYLKGLVLYVH